MVYHCAVLGSYDDSGGGGGGAERVFGAWVLI